MTMQVSRGGNGRGGVGGGRGDGGVVLQAVHGTLSRAPRAA